jgi:hypothetical protein
MKSVFATVVVLAALVTASVVFAQPPTAPAPSEPAVQAPAVEAAPAAPAPAMRAPETVTATVSVVKDAKGEITGVTLTEASGKVLSVMMSFEGKKLEQENGKKVEVTGMIMDREGKPWIHVRSFTLVPEVAPAK